MAVERIREFHIDLGELVQTRMADFVKSRNRIRAVKDAEFQRRVVDEGLTFEQQLNYFKSQLELEKEKTYPDIGFIDDLKKEISDSKKLIRYEKLQKAYLGEYTEWKEGKIGVDSLISFLEKSISEAIDPSTKSELEEELSKVKIAKAESERIILDNRVILAKNDKSIDLINKILGEVNDRRSEALLAGDRETASALDVKIQSLESKRQELEIKEKVHDFEIGVLRKGLVASQKLGLLETSITAANNDIPIMIDNVRWGSELEYWTAQRDAYLGGMGTGEFGDFFGEFSEEIRARTKDLSLTNAFGYVPLSFIDSIDKDYKTLAAKQGFEIYANKIESFRLSDVSNAIDYVAGAIISESAMFGDYEKGEKSFQNIQSKFGVDMTSYLSELYISKITTLPSKAEAIKSTARVKVESITGESFDELNPRHQELYSRMVQELLKSPFGIEPGVLEAITEEFAPKPEPGAPEVKAPPTAPLAPSGYTGPSVVDYLKSIGQPSSFSSRTSLAKQYGITNYAGTAEQNTQLLNILREEKVAPPTPPAPTPPAPPAPKPSPPAPTPPAPPTTPPPPPPSGTTTVTRPAWVKPGEQWSSGQTQKDYEKAGGILASGVSSVLK